jgi:hypothetical protein
MGLAKIASPAAAPSHNDVDARSLPGFFRAISRGSARRAPWFWALLLGPSSGCVPQPPPAPQVGACTVATDCQSNATCVNGTCQSCSAAFCQGVKLLVKLRDVRRLAVVGNTLIMLVWDRTQLDPLTDLYTAPTTGGPAKLLLSGLDPVRYGPGMAYDAQNVYVGKQGMLRVPLDGSPPTVLDQVSQVTYGGLTVAAGLIWYTSEFDGCVDISGVTGDPKTVNLGHYMGGCRGKLAGVDSSSLYFWNAVNREFYSIPIDALPGDGPNSQITPFAMTSNFIDLADFSSPDAVYYTIAAGGYPKQLGRLAKNQYVTSAILTVGAEVTALTSDVGGAYFCADSIHHLAPYGVTTEKLFDFGCTAIATDTDTVYFSVDNVYSIPKSGGIIDPGGQTTGSGGLLSGCAYSHCPPTVTCGSPQGSQGPHELECGDGDPLDLGQRPPSACMEHFSSSPPALLSFPPTYTCNSEQLICNWPEGSVTCPLLWNIPATGGGTALMAGCCGALSSSATGPSCGVVSFGGTGHFGCIPPGPSDTPG